MFVDLNSTYTVVSFHGSSLFSLYPVSSSYFSVVLVKTTGTSNTKEFVTRSEYRLNLDYFKPSNSTYKVVSRPIFTNSYRDNYYEIELVGNWISSDNVRISAVRTDDQRPISDTFFVIKVD